VARDCHCPSIPMNDQMNPFAPDSKLVTRVAPSPNHDERAAPVDMILLHYTGMVSTPAAEARLCDPVAKVSSHYLVYEDGAVVQLVPESRRAWHAGASSWCGVTDINSCSIGIEIANPGHDFDYPDFPRSQIDAVIALCGDIIARHKIAPQRLLAHSDVAPARKNDPGEKFPWDRLSAAGVGLWIEPSEIHAGPELDPGDRGDAILHLQGLLKKFGYGIAVTGNYDTATTEVVTAFQRHFRANRVDGYVDHSTTETLKRLLMLINS
jgi:N-acetylmuramoyl-L-alanine amidase